MKDITSTIRFRNMVVAVRKHCSISCKLQQFIIDDIGKENYCKNFCGLYKYRSGFEYDLLYPFQAALLYEDIESFCYRYCGHENCNNCVFRIYHESYGK